LIPREQVRERLNQVFQNVFNDDSLQIRDEMTAKDIDEWDSLMHINLVVHIEKEFKVRLTAAEVGELKNVGEMLAVIERRVS
jgi:acyl carrier protein